MGKAIWIFPILVIFTLSACSYEANNYSAGESLNPSPTVTQALTNTPIQIKTPTVIYPVLEGTPIPTPQKTTDRLLGDNIIEIAHWGQGRISSSAWSPDGRTLFISNPSGLFLYNYPDLNLISKKTPFNPVSYPIFSTDGKRIVFSSNELELWDVQNFSLIKKQSIPEICLGIRFDSVTGNIIGIFRENESAPLRKIVWDENLQKEISSTEFPELDDLNISISVDLSLAVDRLTPSVYYIWDLVNDKEIFVTNFSIEKYKYHNNCGVSNNNKYILLCAYGNIRIYDLETKAIYDFTDEARNYQPIQSIGMDSLIMSSNFTNEFALLDLKTGKILSIGKNLQEPISIDSSQQKFIDSNGKIFTIMNQQEINVIGQIDDFQRSCCAVSPQGNYLVGWEENHLKLLSSANGELISQIEVAEANLADKIQFTSAEDKLIWLDSTNSSVEIFSLPDLVSISSIPLDPIRIDRIPGFYSMSVSQDGSYLSISAFTDDYLIIIDINQGKIKYQFQGHYSDSIFHPSGILAVHFYNSRGGNEIVKIDPESGNMIESLPGKQIVSLTSDGNNLVVLSDFGLMIENWENGISGPMSTEEADAYYGLLTPLAIHLNTPRELLVFNAKYIPEQNRIYVNNFDGSLSIFELIP